MNPAALADTQLVDLILSGHSELFAVLVERYQPCLRAAITRVVSCPGQTDDILQETLLRAFVRLKQFRRESSLLTWIYRIAVNVAISHQRRWKTRSSRTVELEACGEHRVAVTTPPDSNLIRQELAMGLAEALGHLPESYRTVLVLRDVEDYDYSTIAGMLGISEGNVRSRVHRARQRLRKILECASVAA